MPRRFPVRVLYRPARAAAEPPGTALSSCRAGAIFATVKLALAPDTLADPAGLDTAGLPNRFPGPLARLPRRASRSRSRRRPAGVQRRRDLAARRPVVVLAPDAKDWRLFTTGLFDADLNEPDLLAVNHRAATRAARLRASGAGGLGPGLLAALRARAS